MNSEELWEKVHEIEKRALTVTLISKDDAAGKTIKEICTYWVDHNPCVLTVFTDETALWFGGQYFGTFIFLWRDVSYDDDVRVYVSEWLEEITKNTPQYVNNEAVEEMLAAVKLARETQKQENLEKTIAEKEKELETLKGKLAQK